MADQEDKPGSILNLLAIMNLLLHWKTKLVLVFMRTNKNPFYMEMVTVCVDYADFLEISLERNWKHFDRISVVTSERDKDTRTVCDRIGINYVFTERLYENGDRFNKGKAINDGIDELFTDEWVLIADADMVLPDNFRSYIKNADLDPECVYGTTRYLCPNRAAWDRYQKNNEERHQWKFEGRRINIGVGFFQLANANSEVIKSKNCWYSEDHGHCGRSDRVFWRSWPEDKRKALTDIYTIHLGDDEMGANWNGRVTPTWRS